MAYSSEIPSSMNDACRKLELVDEDIARLISKLTDIHEITQDPTVPAWEKIDNIAATVMGALFPGGCMGESNDVNDFAARGEHLLGVTK